jgi:hypothetical protein
MKHLFQAVFLSVIFRKCMIPVIKDQGFEKYVLTKDYFSPP